MVLPVGGGVGMLGAIPTVYQVPPLLTLTAVTALQTLLRLAETSGDGAHVFG